MTPRSSVACVVLVVFLWTPSQAKYLLDKYKPTIMKPHLASARGGHHDGQAHLQPECGRRFGDGLLGRGHGRDLDSNSEYGEYPWHVGLLLSLPTGTEYVCGGALIDSLHVATAAHCVKSYYPHELIVRLGDWDVNSDLEPYQHQDVVVRDIFLHERFFAGSLHNDLALVRLALPVAWSSLPQVSPICLPPPSQLPAPGLTCWVTGWGQDAFQPGAELQARLQEVDLPAVASQQCQAALQRAGLGSRFRLHPGWLCAGGEEGKDACTGDGGGPLVCPGPGGSLVLAGLVSWGVGCGEAGVPGVYTNIATYVDWIHETVNLL